MKTKYVIGIVVIGVIALAGCVLPVGKDGQTIIEKTVGANPGPDFYNALQFFGGVTKGNSYATSTDNTTLTLEAGDITRPDGGTYDTVIMTPQVGDLTLTFPASSTLSYFLPKNGMMAEQCWVNASSTSGIDIAFAAGTGIVLQSATSTSGGIGAPTIGPSSVGCFKFIRSTTTASTFDIIAAFTTYKDAD